MIPLSREEREKLLKRLPPYLSLDRNVYCRILDYFEYGDSKYYILCFDLWELGWVGGSTRYGNYGLLYIKVTRQRVDAMRGDTYTPNGGYTLDIESISEDEYYRIRKKVLGKQS